MKAKITLSTFLLLFSIIGYTQPAPPPIPSGSFQIRHTVAFKLKYPKGSKEETEFLIAAAKLSALSGVHNFETLRQTSAKNDFEYGLSMEFETRKAYDEYNHHPDHTRFVETYWAKYVEKFMEIDYEPVK